MTITDEIAKIAPQTKEQKESGSEAQLKKIEEVESVLKEMGLPLQERYQLPLSRRLRNQTQRKA